MSAHGLLAFSDECSRGRVRRELLESGELHVRRADAAELNAVRDGALSFEALETLATELRARMSAAVARTHLPADIDYAFVDALALEIIRAASD